MQGGLDSAQRGLHHCGDGSQERPSTARTRVPWEAAPPPVPLERRSPVRRQTHLHLGCPLGRVPPQYGIDSSCCLFSRLMLAYGRVLVAHSWGGTVISEAGMDPKVTALVYVAARAPDAGEDFVALSGKFRRSSGRPSRPRGRTSQARVAVPVAVLGWRCACSPTTKRTWCVAPSSTRGMAAGSTRVPSSSASAIPRQRCSGLETKIS